MASRRVFTIIFFAVFTICRAQDLNQSVNYRLDVTRFDFFTGLEYARNYKSFQPYGAVEVGINRTFFQKRLFPKFTIGLTYDLLKNEKILFGPTIHTSYSFLKVNRNSDHFHHWNELMLGFRLETGKRWKYILTSQYGLIGESYYNQISNDKETVTSYGYLISMGFGYAW